MSILKGIIPDELDAQLDTALTGKDDKVKLANLAEGKYVDKEKASRIENELKQLKKDKTAVDTELAGLKQSGMSADEKLKAALEKAEEDRKTYQKATNKLDAEKILMAAGLKSEDYAELIDGLVTEDKDETSKKATSIASLLTKQKAETEKALKAKLLKDTPLPNGGMGGGDPKPGDFGRELGKSAATTAKSSQDAYATLLKI